LLVGEFKPVSSFRPGVFSDFALSGGTVFGDAVGMDIPGTLIDLYRFPGFEPQPRITTDADDSDGVVVTLDRRPQKGIAASAVNSQSNITIPAGDACGISPAATAPSRCTSPFTAWSVIGAAA
jgi:hypothetical protein